MLSISWYSLVMLGITLLSFVSMVYLGIAWYRESLKRLRITWYSLVRLGIAWYSLVQLGIGLFCLVSLGKALYSLGELGRA